MARTRTARSFDDRTGTRRGNTGDDRRPRKTTTTTAVEASHSATRSPEKSNRHIGDKYWANFHTADGARRLSERRYATRTACAATRRRRPWTYMRSSRRLRGTTVSFLRATPMPTPTGHTSSTSSATLPSTLAGPTPQCVCVCVGAGHSRHLIAEHATHEDLRQGGIGERGVDGIGRCRLQTGSPPLARALNKRPANVRAEHSDDGAQGEQTDRRTQCMHTMAQNAPQARTTTAQSTATTTMRRRGRPR